jgi:hypothetical protein
MKPLLLIDVDGVLSPYAAERCPEGYCEYAFFEGEEPVRLAEVHGKWLRELTESFDLVWATGWGEEAHRLISPVLGLPRFPTVLFPPAPFTFADKLSAVRDYVGNRALVWIEDELNPDAQCWANERSVPTLLIEVDPEIGLTAADIAQVRAWAEQQAGRR